MQKIKNFTIAAAAGIIVISCISLFFRQTQRSSDELVVGMMSGWAPFMTINPTGEYVGFDVDVAKALAQAILPWCFLHSRTVMFERYRICA